MNAIPHALAPTGEQAGAQADRLVLRVLSGRSQGAEHRLPPQRTLAIGHSFENDIVLRDRSTKGCAIALVTKARKPVLRVVAGSVRILGRELGEGEEMRLEPYLPVAMGDIRFAVGGEDEVRWNEAILASTQDEEEEAGDPDSLVECPPTDIAERIELRSQPALEKVARFDAAPKWLAVVGAALLAVAFGSHFGGGLAGEFEPGPEEISGALAAAGHSGYSVERATDGETYAVTGLARDEQALAGLRSWIAQNHPAVIVDVDTIDAVAAAASDLLAAQNIDAVARAEGANALLIEGPFLPADRQRELTELLRRDLPRIGHISFSASTGRGENDLAYFFNAPGYGAASFVDGDPGYLVTEDGTRWFPGAALPTGHRIVEIADGSVTVEREGLRDTIVM